MNIFDEDELERARARIVALWAPVVSREEIARRLSTTYARLADRYGWQLSRSRQEAAPDLRQMYWRACSGDAEAAMVILFSENWDLPEIAALLALPSTRH